MKLTRQVRLNEVTRNIKDRINNFSLSNVKKTTQKSLIFWLCRICRKACCGKGPSMYLLINYVQ
jgi:hypothetical protein